MTYTHAHTCLRYPTCGPRWETSNPILLSFQFHPLSLSCRAIKKSVLERGEKHWSEGRSLTERRMKNTRHYSACPGADQLPLFFTLKSRSNYDCANIKPLLLKKTPRASSGAPGLLSVVCVCYTAAVVRGTWWPLLTRMNESLYLQAISKH